MLDVLNVTPTLWITVLQPNKRSADVRRTVLGVVNDHRLFAPGRHEDFDGIVVIAVGALVERALDAGDLNVPMVRSNNPALALEVETFPGQVKKWGLTFLINTEDVEGFRSGGSLTWGGVHNTYFWIDLKKRITAVVLMQILPIGDPHVQQTMIGFERSLYAAVSSIADPPSMSQLSQHLPNSGASATSAIASTSETDS